MNNTFTDRVNLGVITHILGDRKSNLKGLEGL